MRLTDGEMRCSDQASEVGFGEEDIVPATFEACYLGARAHNRPAVCVETKARRVSGPREQHRLDPLNLVVSCWANPQPNPPTFIDCALTRTPIQQACPSHASDH